MSATGRSDVRKENDFYETPVECTLALLDVLHGADHHAVLDPCCGDRAILNVVSAVWNVPTVGFDIDDGRNTDTVRDALSPEPWGWNGMVITNPPYKHALPIVERALVECPNSIVAMLLRLPFLESARRREFHQRNPANVYVFSKRPSFTNDGKTDATAYAWFVWGNGVGGHWSII